MYCVSYVLITNQHLRLQELHKDVQPFLLRRMKDDVESTIPIKEETVIEVEHKAIHEHNFKFLSQVCACFVVNACVCLSLSCS